MRGAAAQAHRSAVKRQFPGTRRSAAPESNLLVPAQRDGDYGGIPYSDRP